MSRTFLHRFARDRRGASALEFALLGPVFCLMFAAVVDLGAAAYTKIKLDAAVAAGVNYALVNASKADGTNGQTLANDVASIVSASQGSAWADSIVAVNNGPQSNVTGGTNATSGTASNANSCYCPTASNAYGTAKTCGSTCSGTNSGYAGKFVTIAATRDYTPLFSTFGLIKSPLTSGAMVQVQ